MAEHLDTKGRKELDLDLVAVPGKPRSRGTKELMAAFGMGQPRR